MSDPVTIKEREPGGLGIEPAVKDVSGQEIALPKEVAAAGVKVHPTSVTLPQPVSQMGVTPTGQTSPPPTITVVLPLTDDQIVQGLTQSITSSLRWLAEWCVRRLKQIHLELKAIHGKIMRVKQ